MWLRVIIISLVIWLIIRLLKRLLSPGKPKQSPPVANMVRCEYCNLFLPENEAVISGAHFYCSEEHKSLARK